MTTAANTALVGCEEIVAPIKPGRLMSVDLLRGLTIGFMILVNDNGSSAAYAQLKHSVWNGFTATDLVFPTFLFLVGLSTVFSTASRLARGESKRSMFWHTVRRAVILFLLGLLVNSFPHFHWQTLRVYGVLPRIAICYFVVATLYLMSPAWRNKAALAIALLVGYWALMRFFPVPGYGVPGRDVALLDPDRNLVAWVDRHIFAASHLYERTRDPEGLLSTLPAVATTLIGLLTGIWLRTQRALSQKIIGIAVAGVTCVLLGWLWNFTFPINKKLWTSSFVLFAVGWILLLLALSIWAFDERNVDETKGKRRSRLFTPLLVFGANAISAYVFSELLASVFASVHVHPRVNVHLWLYRWIESGVPFPAFASLLYSLGFVAICWLPAYWLYRRRIFIKV
jgi:predicted acyltransferase